MPQRTAGKESVLTACGRDFPISVAASRWATIDDVTSNAIASVHLWAQDAVASSEPLPIPRDMDALRADPRVAAELSEGSAFVVVPLLLDRGRARRVNISIDEGLIEAIDAAARDRGLTRSAFLGGAAREKIAGGA